jgi:hypothetical protein
LPPKSGARMRKSRSVLGLFVASVLIVSFAVQAEDIPETLYDESEALPYEKTLSFSNEVLQHSAQVLQSILTFGPLFRRGFLRRRDAIRAEGRQRAVPPNSDLLTILDHSLRC